ncbi:MAG: sulfotransferase [Vicinamibacterales bacterium]
MGQQPVREPDFFLVGASRAGTTSFWRYLVQHPEIYMPPGSMAEKEPCHFCEVTPKWATAYRDRDNYLGLFSQAGDCRVIGEASTPYLVAPEVPGRIRAAYPDAKILVILRNPVDRAFSLYRYLCLIGAEWVSTFEKALLAESSRRRDQRFKHSNPLWYALYEYFHSGLYSAQIERYLSAFPEEQVKVILFDDLERDPLRVIQEVYGFLGVDRSFAPKVIRYNGSQFPFSVKLQYLLGRDLDRSAAGRYGRIRGPLFKANARLGRLRPRSLDPRTRRRLRDAYRDDLTRLSALINRPLDGWLTSCDSSVS